MNKKEYYKWIDENDIYPKHPHKWIVRTYIDSDDGAIEVFYRNFGPFETKEEASEFIASYKMKYTTKRFITKTSIQPICEAL